MALRITTRLIVAWTLSGLLVFGGYGVTLVRAERAELRTAAERELTLLGGSLEVAIENAMRDGQFEDVDEAAALLEELDETVDVYVHAPDGGVLLSTGWATGADARWLPTTPSDAALRWVQVDGVERLLLVTTLQEPGSAPLGTLVVSRSLGDVRRDLARTATRITVTVLGFVLASAVLGWILGTVYIGRPLSTLALAMRDVRHGDLWPGPTTTSRDDEVGALAAEFDAMVAELREARARLRAEEDARRDLQQALQRADKLVTLGQLAATVAHEIGSPLQVLHGRAAALLRRADDPEAVRRHARILQRETERVTRIVEQLLATTRHRPAARAPVELNEGIRQALDLLELEARRREVALIPVTDAPCVVEGDPDRLLQVVINLVSNALAASSPGGRVEVGAAIDEDGAARLWVRDTGCGMDADLASRVFEAFVTTRAEVGGTGLGLTIVQGIVDQHGGSVTIDTTPGSGTTVTVRLAAHPPGGPT